MGNLSQSDFKLAHVSDPHAGYKATQLVNSQGINLRESDGYVAFARIVNGIIQEECDAVVIAGDIFHTPTPEIRAIIFMQNQFRKLSDAGIPIYALAGNHDTNDIRADIASSRVLHDPYRNIHSHAEPYVTHEITDGIHLHMVSHHMYRDQSETMSSIDPISNEINIFTTHGSIIDPILEIKLQAEHSPREIVIPNGLLTGKDWSYTLLGHIHERGWVGSKDKKTDTNNSKIYYNGSIIRRGFSDKEVPLGKGWTLWNIDSSGNFTPTIKRIPQRPQVDFATINTTKLNSAEITELVIANLQSTQINGHELDTKRAPILRQKLEGLTPAKYAGLDWKNIDENSTHAMSWRVVPDYLINSTPNKTDTVDTPTGITESADVLKVYDEWATKSSILSQLDGTMKTEVTKQARAFVKMGQEEALDAE